MSGVAAASPGRPTSSASGRSAPGTGWWHALLLAHPEIHAPVRMRRALHYFDRFCSAEMTDATTSPQYHARFARRPGTITGEWTGRYMFDAWTPPLLKRAAPDARLLVMLSDPLDRYRSILGVRLARRKATTR